MEAGLFKRLQKVIQGVDLKGPDRVLVMSGRENHRRNLFWLERLEHLETIEPRHLHIKDQEVRAVLLDGAHGLDAVRAFGDDFHIGFVREDLPHPLSRERFVVNDNGANLHAISGRLISLPTAASRSGISTCTVTPPPGRGMISTFCSLP